MHLLCATNALAPLGALSAQRPTASGLYHVIKRVETHRVESSGILPLLLSDDARALLGLAPDPGRQCHRRLVLPALRPLLHGNSGTGLELNLLSRKNNSGRASGGVL